MNSVKQTDLSPFPADRTKAPSWLLFSSPSSLFGRSRLLKTTFLFFRNLLWPLFRTLGLYNGMSVMQGEEGSFGSCVSLGVEEGSASAETAWGGQLRVSAETETPNLDQLCPLRWQDQGRSSLCEWGLETSPVTLGAPVKDLPRSS